jgi:MFS family permease
VALSLKGNLGALQERDFRLLFSGTVITTVGDGLAGIALAFAVLDIGSATDLGIVFAVRQAAEALVLVLGGVISDRLPRNTVMVGASVIQGVAQAATAIVVLGGFGSIAAIVVFQAMYGIGGGLVVPAEVGLVPQTVSPERLQQANALQGLSRNLTRILGPALGGALVVAGSPGAALGIDAVSFLVCAVILQRIRIPPRPAAGVQEGFFHELRAGWTEFTSRTWLWASTVLFGIGNLGFCAWIVLGPVIAKADLGGAGAWGTIVAIGGVGAIVGSLISMRIRPRRPLVACTLAAVPLAGQLLVLAVAPSFWLLSVASFCAGAAIAVHLTLWFTLFQREIPENVRSRVSSYDVLGSFVLMPIGFAIVGPIADAIGVTETLWLSLGVMLTTWAIILSLPSVWAIRSPVADGQTAAPTMPA